MGEVEVEVEHGLYQKQQLHLTTTTLHQYHSSPLRRHAGIARTMLRISAQFFFFLSAKNKIKLREIQKGYPNPLHTPNHVLGPPIRAPQNRKKIKTTA